MTLGGALTSLWLPVTLAVIGLLVLVFLLFPVLFPAMFLHHWLFVDLWEPMWPNIFAPSAIPLLAITIAYFKSKLHREKLHADMKQHITNTTGGTNGCV